MSCCLFPGYMKGQFLPAPSPGRMPVDVVNSLLVDTSVLDREVDAARDTEAVRPGVGHVMGVACQPAAEVLGDDVGAALLGVRKGLKHKDAGALSHDESIAVLIPRPMGSRPEKCQTEVQYILLRIWKIMLSFVGNNSSLTPFWTAPGCLGRLVIACR